ncbi:bifunctional diaminohydroxyphosphoribosylaminopyrimidine deaminase/5-amino-6-(5-phosphoribosylamino)uracil reductase RibD [Abyssibius alkaniclasticus]|uniref:bifunctional diaminohydroxyphosphoribosylaminopyrimidine deaminase/5-amino-6-(5-phosphoribosylamino)uracil reductase RibD n=1 Tax=Abyssibius alkaniclasticus TaxID=2881234 RepID=UPI0040583833
MSQDTDQRWMELALRIARQGLGRVAPNPTVGCVIVKDGRILGRARTADGGRPHAETRALAQAGRAARGATAYVTLEPCAHTGKTPPCADALIAAGVARIVCALPDPDNRVAGRGFEMLRAAGILVGTGLMAKDAAALNAGYLKHRQQGLPWLTLKLATSLDGRIATESGESRWITGPDARQYLHLMRSQFDAVLIGAGTARADNPMLDIRLQGHSGPQPARVVMSRGLDLPLESRLMATARNIRTILLCGKDCPQPKRQSFVDQGAEVISCTADQPETALRKLAECGLTRVLCEGGGQLAASLIAAQLVDELALFNAGLVLGASGRAAIGPLNLGALAAHPRFHLISAQRIGTDTLTRWHQAS